jgi:hypothetical protein
MAPRQPDVELLKHLTVGEAEAAEHFAFSELKKANVRTVKNDLGGIDISPSDALLNGKFSHA